MKPKQIKSENPPLYFIPTAILCSCGQRIHTAQALDKALTAMCTNPLCSENLKGKRIDLTRFAFTDYEILENDS